MPHPVTASIVGLFVVVMTVLLFAHAARAKELSPEDALRTTTTPADRNHDGWWKQRHEAKLAEKQRRLDAGEAIELVFVGDSITHSWEKTGRELWKERFAPLGAFNLGYSGDRTEHVLWRLGLRADGDGQTDQNEIAGLSPKLFVLMIGTNNTGHRMDPAEATAAGVRAIVDRLRQQSPDAQVLLLAVFPRGGEPNDKMRVRNKEINELLQPLDDRDGVTLLDLADVFLDDGGKLSKSIMPDGLHPNEQGYLLWADAIGPHIKRLMAAQAATPRGS